MLSLQEKKALFNILTSILIMGGYVFYTFSMHADQNLPLRDDAQFWAKFILTLTVVTVILKIITHIIFHIIYTAVTRDENPDFMDEYDKKIEMRSERNGNYIFIIGFVGSLIPVAMGNPIYYMFIIMLCSGFVSGIMGELWKIFYYRKGI